MAELLLPAASSIEHSAEASTNLENHAQPLGVMTMHQAIFNLGKMAIAEVQQEKLALTPKTLNAMQRLIHIIHELRSASGWSTDLPQTPDRLLPYVTEEAYDVLEALQHQTAEFDPSKTSSSQVLFPWQNYVLLQHFAPWLLWCVARSSFEAMQLLEGVTAKTCQMGQDWQPGILRLVAYLKLEASDQLETVDLTTYEPPQLLLSPETLIQSEVCRLCHQSSAIATILDPLIQQIQTATPAISSLLTGMPIAVLMPQQPWRSCSAQLCLGFEFVPTADASDFRLDAESAEAAPLTRFTNTNWLNQYEQIVLRQYLENAMPVSLMAIAPNSASLATDQILPLVETADNLTQQLQGFTTIASRNFPQQPLKLDELMLRLLWCFSRSTYEVMQLMSGINAKLLQPQSNWQTGMLRLLVHLKVQTPEADWHLDLITGQPPQPLSTTISETAIVQSETVRGWEFTTLEQLRTNLIQKSYDIAPEIQLLLEGAEVDLLDTDGQWQPGVICLNLDFEFVAL
jgi:hypothetical protein